MSAIRLEGRFLRSKVARRVFVLFLLAAMVPLAVFSLFSVYRVRQTQTEQAYTKLAAAAKSYGVSVNERLLSAEAALRMSAQVLEPSQPIADNVVPTLKNHFRSVWRVERNGGTTVFFGPTSGVPPLDESAELHLAGGNTALLSDVPSAGAAAVVLVRRSEAGSSSSVIFAELDPRYLWGDPDVIPYLTQFCVLEPGGSILYCSHRLPVSALESLAGSASKSGVGRLAWQNGEEDWLGSHWELFLQARFHERGWTILASQPSSAALASLAEFSWLYALGAVLSILLVALASASQIRRMLVPLEALVAGTRRLAHRDFSTVVNVSSNDEFGQVAASFNAMAGRLARQFAALTTLSEIDRVILAEQDLDRVINTVLDRLRRSVEAHSIGVAIIDSDAGNLARVYLLGPEDARGPSLDRVRLEASDITVLVEHPNGLWVQQGTQGEVCGVCLQRLQARCAFVSPILYKDRLAGVITLGFHEHKELPDDQLRLAHDLGDRIGVALSLAARDEQLRYQAQHDSLTALPNRLLFMDRLTQELAHSLREGNLTGVLFIDLDRFKSVNDSVGHAAGDVLLTEAARRLRTCMRKTDTLARFGGDEFVVVLASVGGAADAGSAAEHIIGALSEPFLVEGQQHFLSASVGIALYPSDGNNEVELLRNADTAMYRAKQGGGRRYVYFEERMNSEAVARVALERELRIGVAHRQFVPYYQPQLDLRTGKIVGAEVLVRWQHPQRGLVLPFSFIGLAEETGLIEAIGSDVLRMAVKQYCTWRGKGIVIPRVAVNVSTRQFKRADFAQYVEQELADAGMPPFALELEITESLLMDEAEDIKHTLARLRDIGVCVALDDFGTGYSSLAYLRRFPIDVLKIDRSFVRDIPSDGDAVAITRAIIAMAHTLRQRVIAEGVETESQASVLRQWECDEIQGFGLAKPMPAESMEEFLRLWDEGRAARTALLGGSEEGYLNGVPA